MTDSETILLLVFLVSKKVGETVQPEILASPSGSWVAWLKWITPPRAALGFFSLSSLLLWLRVGLHSGSLKKLGWAGLS